MVIKHNQIIGRHAIHVYELICLFVIIASVLSIALISYDHFHASYVLLGLLIASLLVYPLYCKVNFLIDDRFGIVFFSILVVAILLRWSPYPHHVGGQDQGLYINLSSTYEKYGSLNYTDLFRNMLTDQQKILYDRNGGSIVPGVEIVDKTKSIQQMPFYPLHSLWMANFAKLLGPYYRAYSLLFFSLLSIVGIYLITLEISNNNRLAALLAASFASLNPGLVFFSKFPVSEIVALAFTVNGFYFLVKGYRAIESGGKCGRDFLISVGMFNCFFYTRMSSFFYIPIFLVILFGGLIDLKNNHDRGKLLAYCCALIVCFGISNYFYYKLMPALYYDIISRYIAPFGEYWRLVLGISVLSVIFIFALLFYGIQKPFIYLWIRNRILRFGNIFPIFLPVAILLFLAPIYKSYITGAIDSYSPYHFKVEPGIDTIVFSGLYRIFLYLSPIGFCILLLSSISSTIRNNKYSVLLLLFISSMILVMLFKPCAPYAFYYDRYYISEIVPYSLIIIALTLGFYLSHQNRNSRIFSLLAICLIIGYFAFFSLAQLGKTEGSYPDFFYEVDRQVAEGDLLLLEEDYFPRPRHIKTPLMYYLGKNVFPIKTENDIVKQEIIDLKVKYRNTYLLSAKRHSDRSDFELIKKMKYREGFFVSGLHVWVPDIKQTQSKFIRFLLPFLHYEREYALYLSRVNSISSETPIAGNVVSAKYDLKQFGIWRGVYADGWTENQFSVSFSIPTKISPRSISLKLSRPSRLQQGEEPSVSIALNGIKLKTLNCDMQCEAEIVAPKTIIRTGSSEKNILEFKSSSGIKPAQYGINDDMRSLHFIVEKCTIGPLHMQIIK